MMLTFCYSIFNVYLKACLVYVMERNWPMGSRLDPVNIRMKNTPVV